MRNLSVSHSLATSPNRGGKKGAASRQTAVQNPSVTACAVPAPLVVGPLAKRISFCFMVNTQTLPPCQGLPY